MNIPSKVRPEGRVGVRLGIFLCGILSLVGWLTVPVQVTATEKGDAVTIEHIADGIRHHITEGSRSGEGTFTIDHDGEQLQLQLIRIHMEYLSNLGDGVQFACVDLVEADGTVYDVDFFLSGREPGSLKVTETHVHKLDGRPLYAWEQTDDGTWHRVPLEEASDTILGVKRGVDAFRFRYTYTLPEIDAAGRLWLPYAQSDDAQQVEIESIQSPVSWEVLTEARYGNKALYLEIAPEHSGDVIEIVYRVQRREVAPYKAQPAESMQTYLESRRLVPINERFRSIADRVLVRADTELMRARELYNHAASEIRYAKYGEGWGKGDAVYACDVQRGNCTDFHSYFLALARAAGIPARFIMGAAIPSSRDEGGVDGYHCWAEFYANGQWWPVDISEANKQERLADYYFGRHPANRFEFNRGRDLVFEPGPQSGPINFLAYPILEVEGESIEGRPVFTFERISLNDNLATVNLNEEPLRPDRS